MIKEKLLYDINLLEKQKNWLKISYSECKSIGIKNDYTIDEFGKFELFAAGIQERLIF